VYDHPGIYDQQISEPTPEGCDSIIDLHLVVSDRIINPDTIVQVLCSESYTWNGETYTEDGIYDQTFVSVAGCDSIVTLHLTLSQILEGGTDTLTGNCSGLMWHGHFYDHPGFYTDTIQSSLGCDSIVHLSMTMPSPPDPSEIFPMDSTITKPHYVITSTEFEVQHYDFYIKDNIPGNVWDSVSWVLETECDWILQPFGEKNTCCRVVVLNRVEDTVWLKAKVHSPCDPEGSIERRFWFLCSFYGIDDNSSSTDSLTFDIIPNPNNGEMSIITNNLEGLMDVRVYNMTGLLIDQFIFSATPDSPHHYNLRNYPNGIYLMVLCHQGTITSKKFIISK
jgi:hypothetical protein